MRPADVLLSLAVVGLAVFVGTQVAHRPPRRVAPVVEAAPVVQQSRAPQKTDHSDNQPRPSNELQSSAPSLTAERLAAARTTYMADMLTDLGGTLVRWPERRETGLRIWVQSNSPVHDWDLRYAQMARDAFADWGGDIPIRFDFVLDSASSDVRIVWVDRFAPELGRRIGTTNRLTDQRGWIVSAVMSVAVHDSAGRTIQPGNLAGIVRHEAGHALGLGHSKDPRTKMYPIEMENDISAADRATLKLLYQVAPGPIH